MGAVVPCKRSRLGPRWSSQWGRELCERCAGLGCVVACDPSQWDLRWLRNHETFKGCADMGL
eukprot:6948498-Pyramimonas_sp.AAC.1